MHALLLLLAALAVGDTAPALSTKDIKGRDVALPAPGQVVLLTFASKATGETAGDISKQIRVAHPEVAIYTVIDVSSYPRLLRGMVRSKIGSRHEDALKDDTALFQKAGKPVPPDLDQRIHLIPDFDASICKSFGMNDTGHQAGMAVVGKDGKVKALFVTTPTVEAVKAAVEKEL